MISESERLPGKKRMEVQSTIKNKGLILKRRQQIIKAASRLFFEKGFDRTTMREISRASGLTMGSLYDYVRSKDDILVLVYRDVVERFRFSLNGKEEKDWVDDPQYLEILLRRIMKQMYEMSKAVQLLYRESWTRRRDVHLQMREIDRQEIERIRRLLLKGQKQGLFKVRNAAATADVIFLSLALPALREWSLCDLKPESVIDTVVGFIMKGLSIENHRGLPAPTPNRIPR